MFSYYSAFFIKKLFFKKICSAILNFQSDVHILFFKKHLCLKFCFVIIKFYTVIENVGIKPIFKIGRT